MNGDVSNFDIITGNVDPDPRVSQSTSKHLPFNWSVEPQKRTIFLLKLQKNYDRTMSLF